jgi:hypothetical protein
LFWYWDETIAGFILRVVLNQIGEDVVTRVYSVVEPMEDLMNAALVVPNGCIQMGVIAHQYASVTRLLF